MVKGYFGAGLCFISLVQRQLGIILPAGVMLNVCPEQRPKKQICLEGIIVWGCYRAAKVENTHKATERPGS